MPTTATSLPFLEAQRYFLNKKPLLSEHWDDLWQEAHDMGFMVAGAAQGALLSDLHSAIKKAITSGTTLQQFKKDFDETIAKSGWEYNGSRNWRTRVIYETNVRQSYNAGREAQIADPELRKLRPYGLYVHGDSVVPRPEHLAWDGKVVPLDDPWWDTHTPSNGFGCKCRKLTLSERDLEKRGLEVTSGEGMPYNGTYSYTDRNGQTSEVPNGIDPGFAYRPGGYEQVRRYYDQLQTQIKDYPRSMRTAMRNNFEVLRSPELATRFPVNKLEDLTPLLQDFAKLYPEYLPNGVMGVAEVKTTDPFFNFVDGRFFISNKTVAGINPKTDLLSALQTIRDKRPLSLTQEQVIAGFWHEMVHQQQTYWYQIKGLPVDDVKREIAELNTEFLARHSYQRFLRALGDEKPLHQAKIIKESFGYQKSINRFNILLDKLNVEPKNVLPLMEVINKSEMNAVVENVAQAVAVRSRKPVTDIQKVIETIIKDQTTFDNQLAELSSV